MEEESDAGDDEKEMWNDIREEIATGLADEDFSGVVEDPPIVESDRDLQSDDHSEGENEVFVLREIGDFFSRQEIENGTDKTDDGDEKDY